MAAPAVPGWATAQMMPQEKASPPPPRTPPARTPDVDTPLNLTKPKGSSPSPVASMGEQPVPATAPKLLPPGLVMPRPFMPYAGLPPHLNHLQPSGKITDFCLKCRILTISACCRSRTAKALVAQQNEPQPCVQGGEGIPLAHVPPCAAQG